MTRLEQLQRAIDDPTGMLTDREVDEYVRLCAEKSAADLKHEADAEAERRRVASLRGKALILYALKAQRQKRPT
jgi:hypothetical protein